jgi:DNA-binding response OmpR family regulator
VRKKIIIADDSSVLRATLQSALLSMGFGVLGAAKDSSELFKLVENGGEPDVVMLDIMFPEESGIDILKVLKQKYPRVKVVVITGINQISTDGEIKDAGADDILHKPFDMDDMLLAIEKV